ncbi:MAG: O-antigen ligase family protein [Candidatus Moraniibacteriota bacterium]
MGLENISRKIREKISADDTATLLIIVFSLVIVSARLIFGVVPWYLLVATAPMFFAALLRPRAGVYAVIFLTILFERFFTLEGFQLGRDVIKFYPIDAVLLGVYGGVAAKIVFGKVRFAWRAADGMLVGFFLFATAYFGASLIGFGSQELSVAFSTWKNYVFYGALFFALPILCDRQDDVRRLVQYFLLAAVLGIVFILIGIVRGEGLWTQFTPLSTEGVRLLAFPHAFYFSLAFLSLFVTAKYWLAHRYRPFLWIAMALWAFGILGSLMRHMWIGMTLAIIGALLWLMDSIGRQAVKQMIAIVIAFITALIAFWLFVSFLFPASGIGTAFQSASQVITERVVSIGSTTDESISWRGSTWRSAFTKLSANPVFGTGLGLHIPVESGDYRDFVEIRNIHNSWLALLVQMGLLGFLMLAASVALTAWHAFCLRPETKFVAAVRAVCLTLIVYQAIVLLAQPYLETNLTGIFFWMTLGLLKAATLIADTKEI